jgi:MFS family permease
MEKTTSHNRLAWAVVLAASSFFFYEFIQMNLPNAMDVHLMQAFNLNAPEVGIFASIYFWGNTVFIFPAGSLLDRFSTKKLLLAAIFVCTLGTFLFGISTN